jgi:type III secretory pathway lipoprotein EscJ
MRRRLPLLLLLFAMVMVGGCTSREELPFDLDANEAVEIMVALRNSGIGAEIQKSKKGGAEHYAIVLARSDKPAAFRLLRDFHLPKSAKEEEQFNALTTGDGFVPNLRELSQLRYQRALAVEIEGLLRAFDGVVEAHAVIRSQPPSDDDSGGSAPMRPSKALILVRYVSSAGNQPFSEDDIRRTVVNAVPGLAPKDVDITILRVVPAGAEPSMGVDSKNSVVALAPVAPFAFQVPARDKDRVLALIAALLALFVMSGFIIGYFAARWRKPVRQAPPKAVRTAMLEASYRTSPSGSVSVSNRPQPPASRGPVES